MTTHLIRSGLRPAALAAAMVLSQAARAADTCPCCAGADTGDGAPRAEAPAHAAGSLYAMDLHWRDDRGRPVQLGSLRGRPVVAALFYAGCHVACPVTVDNLESVRDRLPGGLRGSVAFLLVTLDPSNDTPAALAAYRRSRRLGADWSLLAGSPADTQALAAALGIRYRREAYRLVHSPGIVVLDTQGRVCARFPGLSPDLGLVAAAAAAAAR